MQPIQVQAIIANGATASGALDLTDAAIVAVQLPAAWDGVTPSFTLQGSWDGINFFPVVDETGAAISWKFAAGQVVAVQASQTLALRYVKLVASAAQTAQRTVNVWVTTTSDLSS